jgi:LDH2 family malate/lactate/ureidoglycolate dehydrogenase
MQLTPSEGLAIAIRVLTAHGMAEQDAKIVGRHLVDAGMSGYEFASLPRLFAIIDQLGMRGPSQPPRVLRENDRSAVIDGGNTIGYVTSLIGIDKAIEIAKRSGTGIVGVRNTWFSGRCAYYVERAAREGLIAFHTTNTTARVAPLGGMDRILGTNPVAFAFPCEGEPLLIDFGTAATTWGEVVLREKTGEPLPDGWAVDSEGRPTHDPRAALEGAFLPWGGHRGFALALVPQILGILAGSSIAVEEDGGSGFFFLAFDPDLLMPLEDFKRSVAQLRDTIKQSRSQDPSAGIRLPVEASLRRRREAEQKGSFYVDDRVYEKLTLVERPARSQGGGIELGAV